MMELIPILILGILIMVFAGRLLVQASRSGKTKPRVGIEDLSLAQSELGDLSIDAAAMQRIFAVEDSRFVSGNAPINIQRLFREERQALAVLWLRKTQKQLAHLMDIHLKLASYTDHPNPQFEIKLASRYLVFLLFSNSLLLLLSLRGPFEAGRIVAWTFRIASSCCSDFRLRLSDPSSGFTPSGG
jgi:hypothetical protein